MISFYEIFYNVRNICRNKLLLILYDQKRQQWFKMLNWLETIFIFHPSKGRRFSKIVAKSLFLRYVCRCAQTSHCIILMLCCCTIWSMQWICLHKRKQDRHWLSQIFWTSSFGCCGDKRWEESSNLETICFHILLIIINLFFNIQGLN